MTDNAVVDEFRRLTNFSSSASDVRELVSKFLNNVHGLEDKHFLVYAHISPNNIAYVGMTGSSMQNRSGSNGAMYKDHKPELYAAAVEAGGWDCIGHYVLMQGLGYWEALHAEEVFTQLFEQAGYQLLNEKCGYKGYRHTDDAKQKISEASIGRIPSEETRLKISKGNSGKVRTAEQREAARQQKLAYYTPERRKAHGELCAEGNRARQCGKHLSEETRRKIGQFFAGRSFSEEHRLKLSNSHKGQVPANAKAVIATTPEGEFEFSSAQNCDLYFNKYIGWTSDHCRTHKPTPEQIFLRYKEDIVACQIQEKE